MDRGRSLPSGRGSLCRPPSVLADELGRSVGALCRRKGRDMHTRVSAPSRKARALVQARDFSPAKQTHAQRHPMRSLSRGKHSPFPACVPRIERPCRFLALGRAQTNRHKVPIDFLSNSLKTNKSDTPQPSHFSHHAFCAPRAPLALRFAILPCPIRSTGNIMAPFRSSGCTQPCFGKAQKGE